MMEQPQWCVHEHNPMLICHLDTLLIHYTPAWCCKGCHSALLCTMHIIQEQEEHITRTCNPSNLLTHSLFSSSSNPGTGLLNKDSHCSFSPPSNTSPLMNRLMALAFSAYFTPFLKGRTRIFGWWQSHQRLAFPPTRWVQCMLCLTLPHVFPLESHCSPCKVWHSGCSPGRIWWDCFPSLIPFDSSGNPVGIPTPFQHHVCYFKWG